MTKKGKAKVSRRRRKGSALSIWIAPNLKVRIAKIAGRQDRSPSSVARRAIEKYVDEQERPAPPVVAVEAAPA